MLHEHLLYPSGERHYNTNEISFPAPYLAVCPQGARPSYLDLESPAFTDPVRHLVDRGVAIT